jgi:hypothetical protein
MAAFSAERRTTHQTTFSLIRTPHGAAVGDTTEDQPVLNASNRQPFIHGSLYPDGNRHRAHKTSFSEQVNDGPVIVSPLEVRQLQTDQLGTPQAAAQQDGQYGMVSFALRFGPVGRVEKPTPLSAGEPIAEVYQASSRLSPASRLLQDRD